MGENCIEMPRYRSHKIVHALKIVAIESDLVRADREHRETEGGAWITPEQPERYAEFHVDAEYVKKHDPREGGYYVVYDDGYKSWSPAEAFESGYTRLDPL